MTEKSTFKYSVLTESDRRHFLVVSPEEDVPEFLYVIAVFGERKRAENYAVMENAIMNAQIDKELREVFERAKQRQACRSVLASVFRVEHGETVQISTVADPPAPKPLPGAPMPISAADKTFAERIMAEFPRLLELFPKGPTTRELILHFESERRFVDKAMRELVNERRIKSIRRTDSQSHHFITPGYSGPPDTLTGPQKAVITVLSAAADAQGYVKMSKRQIIERAGVSQGGISAVVDALVRKREITIVDPGNEHRATLYLVTRRPSAEVSAREPAAAEPKNDSGE